MLRNKNVPGVPAIHHSLRHVETRSSEIRTTGHVDHAANRPAVDSHAELQARALFERATDLNRALRRCFWAGIKDQRHSVAGGDLDQTIRRVGFFKLIGGANNLKKRSEEHTS